MLRHTGSCISKWCSLPEAVCEHTARLHLQVIPSPFAAGQQDTKPAEDDSENESAISRTDSELREVQQAERAVSEPQQSEVSLLTAVRFSALLLHAATSACTAWQWASLRSPCGSRGQMPCPAGQHPAPLGCSWGPLM